MRHVRGPLPAALNDRAQDVWEPLLAIADLGGTPPWSDRARRAAVALMGDVSDDNLRIELLSDVKAAFEEKTFISSAELVTRLCAREDRPWATFAKGKPINGHRLARLLKLFGVVPAQNPQRSAQGYYQDRLEDSWARYLPTKVSDRPNTNESWPKVTSSECPSPINPDTSKTQESSINPGSQDAWTLQNPDRTEDSMGQDYPLVRDILEVFPGTKVRVIE